MTVSTASVSIVILFSLDLLLFGSYYTVILEESVFASRFALCVLTQRT